MSVRSALGRLVVALLVAGAVAAGCGSSTASPSPGLAGPSEPAATVDAASCGVVGPPVLPDSQPEPGEMDVADLGAGRWRLCLSEPVILTVEGPAWCTWSDDRTAVREISGLPAGIGGGNSTVDGGIALHRGEVYVSSTDEGTVSSWEGSPSEPAPAAGDATRLGTTTFRIPALVDEENPPAVRPPEAAGVISWQCGDAPPPRTGRA